ncbi:MAG TPA: hybrid sensor histidine kinase/response regulator [Ktedonobacterales bacterium]
MRTLSEIATAQATHDSRDPRGRILVIESDEGIARTLAAILRLDGHEVAVALAEADVARLLRADRYDVILEDAHFEQTDAGLFHAIVTLAPDALVIVMARASALETALQTLHAGAFSYLLKPVDVDELRVSVRRGLEHRRLEGELEAAHDEMRALDARMRREIDDATADLRDRVAELDAANQRLQDTQTQHDRFVAMVAHELRGPLNPIINYAQIAKRPTISAETRDHYMDVIVEHAFRLNRLVDDLQTATRLSTGHFTIRREPCDLAAALDELVESFRGTQRTHRFTLERPAGDVTAEVDRDRMMQAARNLIDNAMKYSAEGTSVEVRLSAAAETVSITVRDYGMGIPEAEMQRIFEAFTRLGKSSEVAGSGLGLFITRGIAEAHGGELTVENGAGSARARGATFTLSVPRHAPPGSAPSDPAEPVDSPGPDGAVR